jgi:polyisoprenoid-binding protein YceI
MRVKSMSAAIVLAAAAGPALAQSGVRYQVEPDQVLVTYQVSFGRQQLSGISRSLDWSVSALPDGTAQVRLRVPIDSFESGHPGIDALLRAVAESDRHPAVELDGVVKANEFQGTIAFHGKAFPLTVPLTLSRIGSMVAVRTSFSLDLATFGIAPPAVDSQPIERRVEVSFAARLRVHPGAVTSGGVVSSRRLASRN